MARIETGGPGPGDAVTDVLVIGAGAAGLIAAMRAAETGASVIVLERDPLPRGSTALSAGLIPAAGTPFQAAAGIVDDEAAFARDIQAKAAGEADPERVRAVVSAVAPALSWLHDRHGLPFSVIANFSYPGHGASRMHGLPSRSGAELMDRLRTAAEATSLDIVTEAHVDTLLTDGNGRITGLRFNRPDGSRETVGAGAIILACNGYGGSKAHVARHIPDLAEALYFGHPGNQGDALDWGMALGAETRHLSGHQGHGSVAHPQGILITWATMSEGGFQVNRLGQRFSNEARGYSEQAADVLAQPDGLAWSIFDERIAGIARQFEDFRQAEAMGAVIAADSVEELAMRMGLAVEALAASFAAVATHKWASNENGGPDAFGRVWAGSPQLVPPFRAVRVTGALFHTQGGLVVDDSRRVRREDGTTLPNLFAAGGAACGVSGPHAKGYLSGNGLLTAVADGFVAGRRAGLMTRPPLHATSETAD